MKPTLMHRVAGATSMYSMGMLLELKFPNQMAMKSPNRKNQLCLQTEKFPQDQSDSTGRRKLDIGDVPVEVDMEPQPQVNDMEPQPQYVVQFKMDTEPASKEDAVIKLEGASILSQPSAPKKSRKKKMKLMGPKKDDGSRETYRVGDEVEVDYDRKGKKWHKAEVY